jgi:two-component system sensor histidine kinase KdpD
VGSVVIVEVFPLAEFVVEDLGVVDHDAVREREALERERQATRELRALDDMKNLFLSAVSHELRTPLAGVVHIALTLRRARSMMAEEDVADLLDRLVKSADKLQGLLSDLLDLDRLNRGIVTPKLRFHRFGRADQPHR